jgi:hypothetical protein
MRTTHENLRPEDAFKLLRMVFDDDRYDDGKEIT